MTAPLPSVWPSWILLGALRQHARMMEQVRGWVGGSNGLFAEGKKICFGINLALSSNLLHLARTARQ